MPFIARQSIEEVRNRVNILDVVSSYTQLKRSGSRYSGLSPFTEEKTPSFFVDPDKSLYYCFSTSQGGDLFKFVQAMENLNFQEAVENLASRFGIELQYEEGSGKPGPARSVRNEMLAIHEDATEYYAGVFWAKDPQGEDIRRYWTRDRQFDLEVAREFRIGLAPPTDQELIARLRKKDYSQEALRECGLFYFSDRDPSGNSARPRFRGRLMIPIHDVQGRVVAFTARQLKITPEDDPAHQAKYINSPETPIFKKGDILFGLDRARKAIENDGSFLMVEGQLDAIRCHSCGLETAIAPQGTGITDQQLNRLKRYANQMEVLLDGDTAGQKAAFRLVALSLRAGLETRFLPLQPGQDPDDLLASEGIQALEKLRQKAIPALEFALRYLAGKPFRELTTHEKMRLLEQLYEIISVAETYFFQEALLQDAARLLDADIKALKRDFERFREKNRPRSPTRSIPEPTPAPTPPPQEIQKQKLTIVEKDLLWMVSHFEQYGTKIAQIVDPQWIDENHPAGSMLQKVLAEFEHDAWQGTDSFHDIAESDAEASLMSEILIQSNQHEDFQIMPAINAALKRLFLRFLERQNQALKSKMAKLDPQSDEYLQLNKQRIQLRHQRRQIPALEA